MTTKPPSCSANFVRNIECVLIVEMDNLHPVSCFKLLDDAEVSLRYGICLIVQSPGIDGVRLAWRVGIPKVCSVTDYPPPLTDIQY